jgi:LytS/YehU family sensor histidine kinase
MVLVASMAVTQHLYDWSTVVLAGVLRQLVGFILSLGLWTLYRRWPARDFTLQHHAVTIAAACAAVTIVDLATMEALRRFLGVAPLPDVVFHGVWMMRGAIYVAWTALYFLIRHQIEAQETEWRHAQAEEALREAELLQLRAQMNPHFLFNALNTIIAQAEDNPKGVVETTHAVADYLRYSLSHSSHHAPLGAELDAMRNYLQVESIVHGPRRIEWSIDASVEARRAVTPTALVQPLLENAIKYGLRTSPRPLQIRVSARVEGGRMVIAVENSGTWVESDSKGSRRDSTGVGLENLRRRLELLYPDDARLVTHRTDGWVSVEVNLPFQT